MRLLSVFGYDHAPHGHFELRFENVRVPAESILLSEGRDFEIAQGRLGPGRIHHCMRAIGLGARFDGGRAEIAMIKVVAPRMAQAVLDRAVEVLAAAASGDFGLAEGWALARTLRLADGPDEVHINQFRSSSSTGRPNCGASSGRRRAAQALGSGSSMLRPVRS